MKFCVDLVVWMFFDDVISGSKIKILRDKYNQEINDQEATPRKFSDINSPMVGLAPWGAKPTIGGRVDIRDAFSTAIWHRTRSCPNCRFLITVALPWLADLLRWIFQWRVCHNPGPRSHGCYMICARLHPWILSLSPLPPPFRCIRASVDSSIF